MKKSCDKDWQLQEKSCGWSRDWLVYLLELQRVIRSKLIFLHAIEAMLPVAHERKSPVDKAAKVGVQVPAKANVLFCWFVLTACLRFDRNKIQDLIYRWQQEYYK